MATKTINNGIEKMKKSMREGSFSGDFSESHKLARENNLTEKAERQIALGVERALRRAQLYEDADKIKKEYKTDDIELLRR